MKKQNFLLLLAGFMFILNVFCWQEIFVLSECPGLEVVFFDVGQGDSAFVQTKEKHQILIDGGPGSAVLEKLAGKMPFWDRSIDVVILTHPEKDHMQGIIEMLSRYKVEYFVWNGIKKESSETEKLAGILEKHNQKIVYAERGEVIKLGRAIISVILPEEALAGQEVKNTNDSSVVIRLDYGENCFLFTGDISSRIEKSLVGSKETVDLECDVLKVAHHGSKYSTSEEFLGAVAPAVAAISAGRNNSYGHPTGEVLERLSKFGVWPLRTDEIGDITLLSDGNKIYIK